MKNDLSESILKAVMTHWEVNDLKSELNDIQIISEIKYDDYQQYTHGMRYIESLALWLRQFDNSYEKELAYKFIKNKLIYVSEEEMRQLVDFSYDIIMKPYLIKKTRTFCNNSRIYDKQTRKSVYKYLKRKSLFLGLSDGAHIDFFRRQNPQLSNEQVFLHYDFSENKSQDMLEELKRDIKGNSNYIDFKEKDTYFDSFFLVDDFSASGRSYIRKDKTGCWHGKIHKFYCRLKDSGYMVNNIDIHLVLYVSTNNAINYIKQHTLEYFEDKNVHITIDAVQLIEPINCDTEIELEMLLKNNYNRLSKNNPSFEDKHFSIGEGKYPYRGFSDCSLALVLYHNTPNNSFPILWYSWGDEVNSLFPRISRHKEI